VALALALGVATSAAGCANALDQARAARQAGDIELAQEHYRAAIEPEEPNGGFAGEEYIEYLVELSKETKKRSERKKAEGYLKEAVEVGPNSDVALTAYVRFLSKDSRRDEAITLLDKRSSGDCAPCTRLLRALLVERGSQRYEARQWAPARDDYQKAYEMLPSEDTALALAQCDLAIGDLEGAVKALQKAAGLLKPGDKERAKAFADERRQVVLAAARGNRVDLADQGLALAPPSITSDEQAELYIETAVTLRDAGNTGEAAKHFEAILAAHESGKLPLSEQRLAQFQGEFSLIHGVRGVEALRRGDVAEADKEFALAQDLDREGERIKLQRILTLALKDGPDAALGLLAKLPGSSGDKAKARAKLYARKAFDLARAGKLGPAQEAFDEAAATGDGDPMLLAARAAIQAATPVELDKKQLGELRSRGRVSWPGGKVHHYAQALASLQQAKGQLDAAKADPLPAPGVERVVADMLAELGAAYPWRPRPMAAGAHPVVIKNPASKPVKVAVKGEGLDASFDLDAQASKELTLGAPGLVTIASGTIEFLVYVEPAVGLEIEL
jgi:tetratricopeptide (TPR) repeat protein